MNIYLQLKLIARGWWRNRLFFLISLFSLTVGLGCTNLLITFFIHEYNVEKENPDRESIYLLRQDSPMSESSKINYVMERVAQQVKDKYAEVEEKLDVGVMIAIACKYGDRKFDDPTFLYADSALQRFFPYTVLEGSLQEVLTVPDLVAVSESYARKLFGDRNGIGETLEIIHSDRKTQSYRVAAIVKERNQSILHFDLLTSEPKTVWGSPVFLKLQPGASPDSLEAKIARDELPTLVPVPGLRYHVDPLQEVYFNKNRMEILFRQADVQRLYIGLAAALLVLVIACFNYTNLNLSRTLQQLKMIHIEKLMGARLKEIRTQLFLDATCMVLMAFALSLLLINDLLPGFNHLFSAKLTWGFLFSGQVLPWLLAFVLVLAVTPTLYISHRFSTMSLSEYRKNCTGRQKQRLVGLLVMLQFVFSIGLVYAATVAQSQMDIIEKRAHRYTNVIETGSSGTFGAKSIAPFHQRIKHLEGVEAVSLSTESAIMPVGREIKPNQPDGDKCRSSVKFISTDGTFLSTMRIQQTKGLPPAEAYKEYGHPVLINEHYAQIIHADESSIGHRLDEFDTRDFTNSIIAGFFESYPTQSLDAVIGAQSITLASAELLEEKATCIQMRLKPESRKETLRQLEKIWQEMYPEEEFAYTDMHEVFLKRNQKVTALSGILMTYSLIALALTCFGLFGISWYAVRQRTREIAIRKVHGASTLQVVWLLNRNFFAQIAVAYVVAIPIGWWLMQHWLEQFVYRAALGIWNFIAPLLVVFVITLITVTLHSWSAAQSNPVDSLKTE